MGTPTSAQTPARAQVDATEVERAFEKKLKCSLLLEDVDPFATLPIIRTALGQFGTVRNVQILKSPLDPKLAAKRVIVEMATACEAAHAVQEMQEHAFLMTKGIMRPVIASAAVPALFPDRPRKLRKAYPSSDGSTGKSADMELPKLSCVWVERGDPEWDMVNKQKQLVKKHIAESLYLMQELRKEEEKLAKEQMESAVANMNKYELAENCMKDRTIEKLRLRYSLYKN